MPSMPQEDGEALMRDWFWQTLAFLSLISVLYALFLWAYVVG